MCVFVCVCVCVCACVRACVRACVCVAQGVQVNANPVVYSLLDEPVKRFFNGNPDGIDGCV